MQPLTPQPFAIWNPASGVWETSQLGLSGRSAPYSETWPTSGRTRAGSAYPLPSSAHRIPGSASSFSRIAPILFRTPLASDASRGGESGNNRALSSGHRPRLARAEWLDRMSERVGESVVADRWHLHRWGRYADAIARWEYITGSAAPSPALLHESGGPRPAPAFLEWLMGLERGWVTGPAYVLTANQQITALGNGVLPLQAAAALEALLRQWE